jgi:hypothetical protein
MRGRNRCCAFPVGASDPRHLHIKGLAHLRDTGPRKEIGVCRILERHLESLCQEPLGHVIVVTLQGPVFFVHFRGRDLCPRRYTGLKGGEVPHPERNGYRHGSCRLFCRQRGPNHIGSDHPSGSRGHQSYRFIQYPLAVGIDLDIADVGGERPACCASDQCYSKRNSKGLGVQSLAGGANNGINTELTEFPSSFFGNRRMFDLNAFGLCHMRPKPTLLFRLQSPLDERLYPAGNEVDPTGPSSGSVHIQRGGSWGHVAYCCQSAYRDRDDPDTLGHPEEGVRVALDPRRQLDPAAGKHLSLTSPRSSPMNRG